MAKRNDIIKFINNYLEVDVTKDRALNGLQVEGKDNVEKIAVGVSASLQLFKKAAELKADMVIVHHGLFWGEAVPIKGYFIERIRTLIDHNMSLAAYHLPLDKHPVVGNNAQLINLFDVTNIEPFAKYKGMNLGFKADFVKPTSLDFIVKTLEQKLFAKPFCLNFGKDPVHKITAVSGGAPEIIYQAIDEGVDLFLTGEPTEYVQEVARESKINFIAAGHYNSEKLGVIALAKLLETEFKVKTQFLDVPNPV